MGFLDTNCTVAPQQAQSDAGVAGTGVLLSFMITAILALILSTSVIIGDVRRKPTLIRRKLLNGYSDSQIMQGIGIQSVGLAQMKTLIPYHFFLIWMLSLLSMATHNATLLALVHDYRRDWVLRWLRQFLMFVNLALSSVSGIFVLQIVSKGLVDSTLPVACAWDSSTKGHDPPGTAGLSYVGTIAVIAGNCIVFGLATWYLHSREQRFFKAIQLVGLVLMAASAVGAAVRIITVSQAFGNPGVNITEGEKDWSFGQLLSMLLLVLPLVSAVEIYRGDIKVAPPIEEDRQPLYDTELQSGLDRHNFQPNPFFGSESNLFKK